MWNKFYKKLYKQFETLTMRTIGYEEPDSWGYIVNVLPPSFLASRGANIGVQAVKKWKERNHG